MLILFCLFCLLMPTGCWLLQFYVWAIWTKRETTVTWIP
jgi:hypothetical protein